MSIPIVKRFLGENFLCPVKNGPQNGAFSGKLIQKTSEVLSLLRPIVHDTSNTAKITWFILVLHWAVDVIERSLCG